jgi:hypothetical protein
VPFRRGILVVVSPALASCLYATQPEPITAAQDAAPRAPEIAVERITPSAGSAKIVASVLNERGLNCSVNSEWIGGCSPNQADSPSFLFYHVVAPPARVVFMVEYHLKPEDCSTFGSSVAVSNFHFAGYGSAVCVSAPGGPRVQVRTSMVIPPTGYSAREIASLASVWIASLRMGLEETHMYDLLDGTPIPWDPSKWGTEAPRRH